MCDDARAGTVVSDGRMRHGALGRARRTHVMILPLTPEGKSDLDSLMCAPTASGHGSGQQPPAWSAQRSSTVGENGMPLKEKPYEAVPPVTSLERS